MHDLVRLFTMHASYISQLAATMGALEVWRSLPVEERAMVERLAADVAVRDGKAAYRDSYLYKLIHRSGIVDPVSAGVALSRLGVIARPACHSACPSEQSKTG